MQCVSRPARVLPHGSCVFCGKCVCAHDGASSTVFPFHPSALLQSPSFPRQVRPPQATRVQLSTGTSVIHHLVAAGSTQRETRNGLVTVRVSLGDMQFGTVQKLCVCIVCIFPPSRFLYRLTSSSVASSWYLSPLPHHFLLRKRVCWLWCLLRQRKSLNMVKGVYNQGYIMYLKLLWYVLGLRLSIGLLVSYQFISIYSTVGIPFRKSTLCDHWDQLLAHCSHCPIVQPTWLRFFSADQSSICISAVGWLVGCNRCCL